MPHIKIPHGIRQRLRTRLNKDEYFQSAKYSLIRRRRNIVLRPKNRDALEVHNMLGTVIPERVFEDYTLVVAGALQALLDRPAQDNPLLAQLLTRPSIFTNRS